jgi:hypothetical protein
VTWLAADIDGDGRDELVECQSPDGEHLELRAWAADDTGNFSTRYWVNLPDDKPQTLAWLVGDIDHNNRVELVQVWDNGGQTGITVYGCGDDGQLHRLSKQPDTGQPSDALAWLIGDINNDGKAEIIQCRRNRNGNLGLIVYAAGAGSVVGMAWRQDDMQRSADAVAWMIGDANHDMKAEVVQCQVRGSGLDIALWGTPATSTPTCTMQLVSHADGIGQAHAHAQIFHMADLNHDGAVDIVQCWANSAGRLGMAVYGWDWRQAQLISLSSRDDMGEPAGAIGWLVGDVDHNAWTELIQITDNNGKLGMIVWGDTSGNGYFSERWRSDDMGHGTSAATVCLLAGCFLGGGRTTIFQGTGDVMNMGGVLYRETPIGQARPQFDDAAKVETLVTYAPRVRFAPGEHILPAPIEWTFPHLRRFRNDSDEGRFWLTTKDRLASPTSMLPYFAGNIDTAPVYAFWVDKGPFVDLVYFFYYAYNRGKQLPRGIAMWGNHVGDWEHVTVRLVWHTVDGSWKLSPNGVYLSAHDAGGAYYYTQVPKIDDTHPTAYAALGSHGMWLKAGEHVYANTPFGELKDICGEGHAWDTWQRVICFDFFGQVGLGGASWPAWMSDQFTMTFEGMDPESPWSGPIYRWGNQHDGVEADGHYPLDDGPEGPISHGMWDAKQFE